MYNIESPQHANTMAIIARNEYHIDMQRDLVIRQFTLCDYQTVWQAMLDFTDKRTAATPDELWLLEHFPVFTQGQAGKPEHVLNPGDIPLVQSDRGGQVTYHGPGQLIAYTLFDLQRLKIAIRPFVTSLEKIIVELLSSYHIVAETRCYAPGVYVKGAKICSIGLRVRKGCSYHGIAFNVAMDLTPFSYINPCGFQNLPMTQLSELISHTVSVATVKPQLIQHLIKNFGYNTQPILLD